MMAWREVMKKAIKREDIDGGYVEEAGRSEEGRLRKKESGGRWWKVNRREGDKKMKKKGE